MRQGELSAAEAKYRRSLAIRRAGSADSSKIATTLNNLGLVLKEQGNLAAADSLYQKSLSIKRSVLPPRHQRTTLHNRAYVVMKQGRYALADSLFREALAMRRAEDGARSADVAQTQAGRALLACQRGNYRKAEHLARTALTIRREQFRAGHPRVQESLQDLLKIYREWNRPHQAADYRQRLATRSGKKP